MQRCYYGCGKIAKHQFKNGKWCCEDSHNKCPVNCKKNSIKNKGNKKNYVPWNKGKTEIYSDEVRKKISNSLKGRPSKMKGKKGKPSKYKGMSYEQIYGEERAKEIKDAISYKNNIYFSIPENNSMFGIRRYNNKNPFYKKQHSNETKEKLRRYSFERFKDPTNHPSWKGGLSKNPYCHIFNNNEWRDYIHIRDKKNFCWNPQCNKKSTKNCLHHINYDKKDCSYCNIITICISCNSLANFNRDWWKSYYKAIMNHRGLI
jgi:hypothetical protein